MKQGLSSTITLRICLGIFLLLVVSHSYAQQSILANPGSIKGKVKDSTYNFMLTSATVAVYKAADSSIVQFTLPNELGEFTVSHLPVQVPLKLIITHVGYRPFIKTFLLTAENKEQDLGLLYLFSIAGMQATEQEVIVTSIAPMRMRGDTLEFNADAFKLDSNATAEDLMRKLPGFTIWGDGEITFNGKKLQSILVDGKPFFGNNISVATQNLPKNIIDKIQVYQQSNEHNPYDSTLFANIKLKAGKKLGHFGKLSAGMGTDKRYAADGMFSAFNRKMQFSAVAAGNNLNKIANNVGDLIKSSSFKGEGANIDYQPNLSIPGFNRPLVVGVQWQYDFLPDVTYFRKHRANADYFLQHNTIDLQSKGFVSTALAPDSVQTLTTESNSQNRQNRHLLSARYDKNMPDHSIVISANAALNQDKRIAYDSSLLAITGLGNIGTSRSINEEDNTDKNLAVTARYQRSKEGDQKNRIPRDFGIEYTLGLVNKTEDIQNKTANNSFINPAANRIFDRQYNTDENGNSHTVKLSYPRLKQMIFGNHVGLGGIEIGLSHSLNLTNNDFADNVLDLDPSSGKYRQNTYLTNKRNEHIINQMPALGFFKNISKGLTHRYYKNGSISINVKGQYYSMKSRSEKPVQNFRYHYWYFIPDLNAEFSDHQYGSREMKYTLRYQTNIGYPQLKQIAPLIDSSNYWFLPMGNRNIVPETERKLSFQYNYASRKPKNPLNIDLLFQAVQKSKAISDSVIYDPEGRRYLYYVNMAGNKNLSSDFSVKKSFEKKKNTFQIQLRNKFSIYRTPQYVNSILNISGTTVNEASLQLDYSFRDKLAIKAEQGQSVYVSSQQGFNNTTFRSNNIFTRLITTFEFPNKLLWNSNITYNRNSNSYGSQLPVHITIWNASVTHRFLKGEKGEIKFAALDLLHQNRNIVNTAYGNTQIFNFTNVLQQYFLLTFSYYPRKFGK